MLTIEEIRALDADGRAELARRLAEARSDDLQPPSEVVEKGQRLRHWFLIVTIGASLALIPWIVVLAVTLPRRYVASRWDATWVGFDMALMASLACTAYLGWRRRQLVQLFTFTTATLLTVDAWFDVMTTTPGHGDRMVALLSALLVELPLGAFLAYVGVRLLRFSANRVRALRGEDGPLPRLWQLPLVVDAGPTA